MTPLLELSNVMAWYGEGQALHGITFQAVEGQVVALLGRNGAGKSTTLKSIMGLVQTRGVIRHAGEDIRGWAPHRIAQRGIGYCPEERAIFSALSVQENLRLPARLAQGGMSEEAIYDAFPPLKHRRKARGGQLSGGEQQMLAIARILRAGHRLLLLDEPSEGLAPVIVDMMQDTLLALKKQGYSIVLVEQNLALAGALADRFFLIDAGRVAEEVSARQILEGDPAVARRLGV